MKKRVYLDHAATTPVSRPVLDVMMPFFENIYGNASSVYGTGREARKAIEKARRQVADAIGAEAREIIFTSGGSESDNLAVQGTAFGLSEQGRHIITTAIEHPAVLNTCRWLEKHGFEVSYVNPGKDGRVSAEDIRKEIRKDTILISVMTANNETGMLQPVEEIGAEARERNIAFHTDAVQAIGSIPVNVNENGADLLSLSGHKFYGPKGIGALYVRKGSRLDPLIHGGEQERGLRAGTENTAAIAGLGMAIETAVHNQTENAERMAKLRNRLTEGILRHVPDTRLNGSPENRLPNNCNIAFQRIDGEALLLRLDLAGIEASGGSACTSGSREISHVLTAMGLTGEEAKGSLRFTTGPENTEEEIDYTIATVKEIITDLRSLYHG